MFFAPDFVWQLAHFHDVEEYTRMMDLLKRTNTDILIGHYFSACTTTPRSRIPFPPNKVPLEECEEAWLLKSPDGKRVIWPDQPGRYYLDMRNPTVRNAVISLAAAQSQHYGYNAISFDNCSYGYGIRHASIPAKEWTDAFMAFYEEAGHAAREANLKCVVNIACRADDIPIAFRQIAPLVDGIMTELPFHPNIIELDQVDEELQTYRDVLEMGKMVFLIQVIQERVPTTLRLVRPLTREYAHIYVAVKEWKEMASTLMRKRIP